MIDQRSITELIHEAIQAEVEKAIEEELAPARKRIEDKVRGQVGSISARVLERFTFERYGNTLRIEVNFEGIKS